MVDNDVYRDVYFFKEVKVLETAKVFLNGRSQAVRLPKNLRFSSDEVYIQKVGDAIILFPKDRSWDTFLNGLNSFTADVYSEGRSGEISADRESL